MGQYTIRRLLQFIPVLLGTMFLLHYLQTISFQISGNPIRAMFGDRQPPPQTINAMTARFGLDDPCLDQTGNPCVGMFFDRLVNYAQGDFGINFNERPVLDMVVEAAPVTIQLTLIAIAFEALVGIIAGVLAALRKDRFADNLVRMSTVLLISVPVFVLGVLVQIFSGLYVADWFEARGAPEWVHRGLFAITYTEDFPWLSLLIPGLVLGSLSLAFIARLTRTSVIESLTSDYVRTARAKGLRPRRVVGVHALRNSLIPVITYIGVDVGTLMGGSIVTEGVFNIPGVGGLTFTSVRTGDTAVVIAVVTLLVLVYLVTSLLVDLVYAVLDPRIRYD